MYEDLLASDGLIIKSRYYDFNDTIEITLMIYMVYHKPFNGKLNLTYSDILSLCI